jgi:hypothetical protein
MSEKNTLGSNLPSAIIIAATMICISLLWINHSNKNANIPKPDTSLKQNQREISDVTSTDHILGNPNAPIKIVEYSDTSCPFCKMFHPIMKQIIDIYGPTGKVAWIYRHFPLDKVGTRSDGGSEGRPVTGRIRTADKRPCRRPLLCWFGTKVRPLPSGVFRRENL